MEWYLEVLKKYAVFEGRARRKEYWMFVLVNFIVAFMLFIVDMVLGVAFIYYLYSLAVFIPGLAVGIRRLHDTNRSGWWLLLALVPVIGAIVVLVFLCLDSDPHNNRYGSNPKAKDVA